MRTIHIENQKWQYKVGKQHVVIQTQLGSKICVPCHIIKNMTSDNFDRGKWKKTSDGMITPKEIKDYIISKFKH